MRVLMLWVAFRRGVCHILSPLLGTPMSRLQRLRLQASGSAGSPRQRSFANAGEKPLSPPADRLPVLTAAWCGARLKATLSGVGCRCPGARLMVVAGGETSGAVVAALGVQAPAAGDWPADRPLRPLDTGARRATLLLALKSGNFGSRDFFGRALEVVQ
ncbi:nucleotide-binding domain containing protein [Accumulibacter sp.]|uniref:nucleotide-binding domain containing protein n=2 Tax=Accumulibacter sp. TaxID=2053492 RepID=UPI002D1FB9F4|nr:nucleotide-binding domain containing protein [Accumulibacter sp.]